MRSRIPPLCPASPDYQHGMSSFVDAGNGCEKNFRESCVTMVDVAATTVPAVPNREKRQRTFKSKRISGGVLVGTAPENTSLTSVSDGRPLPTEPDNAPRQAVKLNGNKARSFSTMPFEFTSEGVEPSPVQLGRGCRKRCAVREAETRRYHAAGKTTKIETASDTSRARSSHDEDDLDTEPDHSANKRFRRKLSGRFSHSSLDTEAKEQQLLLKHSPSSFASIQACSLDKTQAEGCHPSLEATPSKSTPDPLELRRAHADVISAASSSESISLDSGEKRHTALGNAMESEPHWQQPVQMDPHTAVELVMKLWKPLPPASSLLRHSKNVVQELREVLASRMERGEAPSLPPSPVDTESRAFLFECLSARAPAAAQCEASPVFLPALSGGSAEQGCGGALLCASPSVTSTAVSTPADSRSFPFSAGYSQDGKLGAADNGTSLPRARKTHSPAVAQEGNPPSGLREAVAGGGGNKTPLRTSDASSVGPLVRKTERHQTDTSLSVGVETAVDSPALRGDKAGSKDRPSRVHGVLADPFAFCHRHRELSRFGQTSTSPPRGVRFSHLESASGDCRTLGHDEASPSEEQYPVKEWREKVSSKTSQCSSEKDQPYVPPKGRKVATEGLTCVHLVSNRNCAGDEGTLKHEAHALCESLPASDTKEAYGGCVETSCTALKTRSGRQVKLNLARFPGLRSTGEPVPA